MASTVSENGSSMIVADSVPHTFRIPRDHGRHTLSKKRKI